MGRIGGARDDVAEVIEVCRKCHKLAPFCFYNGNTFTAIGRILIVNVMKELSPEKAHTFRSVVGHYIAGTIGKAELDEMFKTLE